MCVFFLAKTSCDHTTSGLKRRWVFLVRECARFAEQNRVQQSRPLSQTLLEMLFHASLGLKSIIYFQIQMPSTNQLVMDLMCGPWASELCTPHRWFTYMGDKETPNVPFQVNYIPGDEDTGGFKPYNPGTRPCNVGLNVSLCFFSTEPVLRLPRRYSFDICIAIAFGHDTPLTDR